MRPVLAKRFHLGAAYVALENLVPAIERELPSLPSLFGMPPPAIKKRLVQRIVEMVYSEYLTVAGLRAADGIEPELRAGEELELGGLRLAATGKVRISARTALRGLLHYAAHWGQMLLAILGGAAGPKATGPATLAYGIPEEAIIQRGSDAVFRAYCEHGPIPPLVRATRLIVQRSAGDKGTSGAKRLIYARYPLHALVAGHELGVGGRIALLMRHLASFPRYVAAAVRRPLLTALASDFAQLPAGQALHRARGIEGVVITNSNIGVQLLWMRMPNLKVQMVWYSQNSIPFVYRWDGLVSRVPQHRIMHVHEHWTWTEGFGAYVRSVNPDSRATAIGPIVWQGREGKARPEAGSVVICVFDVTPLEASAARLRGITYEYYYNESTVRAFIQGVIAARDVLATEFDVPVRLKLKHKRQFSAAHAEGYGRWIARLQDEGVLECVDVDENLFAMIGRSHAVIVAPYSSPAYIADALGVPAIYFDPTAELAPTFEPAKHVTFASSEGQLLERLRESLLGRLRAAQPG